MLPPFDEPEPPPAWGAVLDAALDRATTGHRRVRQLLMDLPPEPFRRRAEQGCDDAPADRLALDASLALRTADGILLSTVSSPWVVYYYCYALLNDIHGRRIVESGSGSGWVLALLAELTGPDGRVNGFEIDPDIADASRESLREFHTVSVITADGLSARALHAVSPVDVFVVSHAVSGVPLSALRSLAVGGTWLGLWTGRCEFSGLLRWRRQSENSWSGSLESTPPVSCTPDRQTTQPPAIDYGSTTLPILDSLQAEEGVPLDGLDIDDVLDTHFAFFAGLQGYDWKFLMLRGEEGMAAVMLGQDGKATWVGYRGKRLAACGPGAKAVLDAATGYVAAGRPRKHEWIWSLDRDGRCTVRWRGHEVSMATFDR